MWGLLIYDFIRIDKLAYLKGLDQESINTHILHRLSCAPKFIWVPPSLLPSILHNTIYCTTIREARLSVIHELLEQVIEVLLVRGKCHGTRNA